MPLAAIEAQMIGIPVVGTNVGSLPEVVKNDETGLITLADAKSLANAIEVILQDPLLYNLLSEQSKFLANTRFAVEKMIKNHFQLYCSLTPKECKSESPG